MQSLTHSRRTRNQNPRDGMGHGVPEERNSVSNVPSLPEEKPKVSGETEQQ